MHLLLPTVGSTIPTPQVCRWCQSAQIGHWQTVRKPLRDTRVEQVTAERYGCRAWGRTFRVYPSGVTHAATSQRRRGMAVLLDLLGLSDGATALALKAFGYPWSKTSVYAAVQAAAARVPGLGREAVFNGIRPPALAGDLTSVGCKGKWLPVGVTVDDLSGPVLSIAALSGEDAATLQAWMAPIAEQEGARLLITDDADSFKQVAGALGLPQQVCKAHVVRTTEALIEALTPLAAQERDGSLAQVGVTPTQAGADLAQVGRLIHQRQPEDAAHLLGLHQRYLGARVPQKGETASLAYRLRLLVLDRWNLWSKLTRYRTWRGPHGDHVDGTTNGCEGGIGWWIQERYRPMRGSKPEQSAVKVSRLVAWCGNQLEPGGADLAPLLRYTRGTPPDALLVSLAPLTTKL